MIYELFKIPAEQRRKLCSEKIIENDDLKRIFQLFSSGKVERVRVGKIHITDGFTSKLKRCSLKKHDGRYAFFALEKCKTSFFSKACYRIFIWPLYADQVFTVPLDMVSFESPDFDSRESVMLSNRIVKQPVVEGNFYGKTHSCICEQICASREFDVGRRKIVCTKDMVVFNFRWTNPDYWVKECFTYTEEKEAMFFENNAPKSFLEQTSLKDSFCHKRFLYPLKPSRVKVLSPFGVSLHNGRL